MRQIFLKSQKIFKEFILIKVELQKEFESEIESISDANKFNFVTLIAQTISTAPVGLTFSGCVNATRFGVTIVRLYRRHQRIKKIEDLISKHNELRDNNHLKNFLEHYCKFLNFHKKEIPFDVLSGLICAVVIAGNVFNALSITNLLSINCETASKIDHYLVIGELVIQAVNATYQYLKGKSVSDKLKSIVEDMRKESKAIEDGVAHIAKDLQ